MTLHFLYFYDYAISQGMEPLPREDVVLLRSWAQRVLYGYWTHAGFMNWETGWSYGRWMKAKAWAYSQQGLLAIATVPRFQRDPQMGAWAKYVFDRGLRYYERLGTRPPGRPFLPDAQLFGIGVAGRARDADVLGADGRQRRPRRVGRARARQGRHAAAVLRLRRRRRAAGRQHAGATRRRSPPSTAASSLTAASSWRG